MQLSASLDGQAVTGVCTEVEIATTGWVPAREGIGSDPRELGVMLHSMTAERIGVGR
jgi:hypothetical protein